MIRILLSTIALISVILASPFVYAQTKQSENPGFYAGLGGGLVLANESDLSANYQGIPLSGKVDFDPGFAISVVGGYKWNFGLRTELEYRFARNEMDSGSLTGPGGSISGSIGGDVSAHHFLANAWYDIDFGSKWMPYLGGGVGGVLVDASIDDIPGLGVTGGSDSSFVFGGQAGGGISYAATPNIVADLGYRYVLTSDPSFSTDIPGLSDIDAEYSSHNIMFTVRGHWY